MTSLSRDINDAARAFCSTKNELLVVMGLSNQTIGFGKISDPLTDKRLARITGIRLDRLRPAINAVIEKGLFDRKPHKCFGYEYSIGEMFLQEHQGKVYTPSISPSRMASESQNPISRNNTDLTHMGKDLTEKRRHTVTNLPSIQQQTVPLAEQQSVKLFFNDEDAIPSNFAIETSSANTRIEFSFGNKPIVEKSTVTVEPLVSKPPIHSTPKKIATLKKVMQSIKTEKKPPVEKTPTVAKVKTPKPIPIATIPVEKREPWMNDALEAADYLERNKEKLRAEKAADEEKKGIRRMEQMIRNLGKPNAAKPIINQPTAQKPKPKPEPKSKSKLAIIPLPTSIGEENYNACNRFFTPLDRELQKKLLLVFNYNMKTRTINHPVGYFITLAKTAADGGLTVPPEAIVKKPLTTEQKAVAKAKTDRLERWSDFAWLKKNAALQGMTMAALAKQMGKEIEKAYEMFADTLTKKDMQPDVAE